MRWLFDPVRDTHLAALSAKALCKYLGLLFENDLEVLEVAAEDVGKSGRLDLRLRIRTLGQTTTIVIENKINSSESEDQLAKYVTCLGATAGETIVPILLEIGAFPARSTSCPDARCLTRNDAVRWLEDVRTACANAGLAVPRLVDDYLRVFEAWEVARRIRGQRWEEIARGLRRPQFPQEWSLVSRWVGDGDQGFFDAVLENPMLISALRAAGMNAVARGRLRGEAGFLQISKPTWTLRPVPGAERGVNIHFECRGRRSIRIDVELYPYKGSVAKDPGLRERLEPQLRLKARFIRRIRELSSGQGGVFGQTGLRDADAVATCTAVVTDGPGFESPQAMADGLVRALEEGIPLVEVALAENRPLRPDQQGSGD